MSLGFFLFIFIILLLIIIVILQIIILQRLKNGDVPLNTVEKFAVLTDSLNTSSFNGKARIHVIDQRSFELYDETDPATEIVHFRYRGGTLKVSWTVDGRLNGPLFSCEYLNLEHVTKQQQETLAAKLVAERGIE